ncbi:MAG TPA: MarR family transcriptional regulator [Candidatus Nanopelagicaceae bacterium]|nr:MarR family transcriptional regulator [Candidatus Nanopelagicaceae bacterium]
MSSPARSQLTEGGPIRSAQFGAAEGLLSEVLSAWLGPGASALALGTVPPLRGGLVLTTHQMKAVRCLPANGLTMREFAHALGVSAGSATALADRLVRSGAAERRTERDDRRVVRLVPTAAGSSTAMAYQGAQEAVVAGLLATMPAPSHAALIGAMDYLAAVFGGRAVPANAYQHHGQPEPLTPRSRRSADGMAAK